MFGEWFWCYVLQDICGGILSTDFVQSTDFVNSCCVRCGGILNEGSGVKPAFFLFEFSV